ncbi:winged helix-turn-helix transcriptional regulator [Methanocaldococcus indicus]|uniref:winged helix-turn-helix transcriptional regulator n=1 Tax=Methanocaldococcus indicus TaxID=213231 RepID=UPI003C6D5896
MSFFQIVGKKGCIEVLYKIKDGINTFTLIKNKLDSEGLNLSTRTLSERLSDLEREGLIKKIQNKYILTKKGEEALEIIEYIIEWEKRWEEVKLPKIIVSMLGDISSGENK